MACTTTETSKPTNAEAEDDTDVGSLWPITINLGIPTEQDALRQPEGVRAWVTAWQTWHGAGSLVWSHRHWRSLGKQKVPAKLILEDPHDIVSWIGETEAWTQAVTRYKTLHQRWPILAETLPKYYPILATYNNTDFTRLIDMTAWICAHPDSNLYPRQIPLAGVDTKWLEPHAAPVSDLVAAIRGDLMDKDFYRRCGLKPLPQVIRMCLLDPAFRDQYGGLRDITAPWEEIARMDLSPAYVFITENIQTGLAFQDLPGSVVVMGLGYRVSILAQIPWIHQAKRFYWGDIDTHGFAILNLARETFPANETSPLDSTLMDHTTLMDHRDLWVEEKDQVAAPELPMLTDIEQDLYRGLKTWRWGPRIRLEQERINWDKAWATIQQVIHIP